MHTTSHGAHRIARTVIGLALFLSGCLLSTGCAVTQSVSVQTIEATSPVAAPPVRVTDNTAAHQITVTPHFTWPSNKSVTGLLELSETTSSRTARRDTTDLLWKIPGMTVGVDVDYLLSRHIAFGFGLGLSSLGSRTYGSWTAGFGFINEKENGALRLDLGVQSTPVLYSAVTRIIRRENDKPADTTLWYDNGQDNNLNLYGALTMNTTRKTWPVNLFLNAYITKQRLLDYTPSGVLMLFDDVNSTHIIASHWIIGLTPGLYVTMMDDLRLVLGERIIYPFDIMNQSPYPLLQFHMQLDISM